METRKMSDSELIEALSKGWIERDGDSFVRIRKTGRLGWEKEHSSETGKDSPKDEGGKPVPRKQAEEPREEGRGDGGRGIQLSQKYRTFEERKPMS